MKVSGFLIVWWDAGCYVICILFIKKCMRMGLQQTAGGIWNYIFHDKISASDFSDLIIFYEGVPPGEIVSKDHWTHKSSMMGWVSTVMLTDMLAGDAATRWWRAGIRAEKILLDAEDTGPAVVKNQCRNWLESKHCVCRGGDGISFSGYVSWRMMSVTG